MIRKSVADTNSPDENYITVSAFTSIFKSAQLFLNDINRHFLILGETGSGKTYSCVKPILKGALNGIRNRDGNVFNASFLIIDPKQNELMTFVKSLLHDTDRRSRLVRVTRQRRINFFEGMKAMSLRDKADRLFEFSASFSASARGDKNMEFAEFAKAFFLDLLISDETARVQSHYTSLWELLNDTLPDKIFDLNTPYMTNLKRLIEYISEDVRKNCSLIRKSFEANHIPVPSTIMQQTNATTRLVEQFFYQKQYLDLLFKDYCNKDFESFIFLHPFRCEIKDIDQTISIKKMILNSKILVFSPKEGISTYISNCVGMLIKSLYFRYAIETYAERVTGQIFVFYVCDEFQRYITCDAETGEQSFLDRCRAYDVACVLSTQSISSLKYALKMRTTAQNGAEEEAVNILSINTGNKIYFKSTDRQTQEGLRSMYPHPPVRTIKGITLPHLLDIRPLSSLAQGECYYITSNGDIGKTRIQI